MRVVEIIIDGFKSYQVRTVITGWDESFNSITGLNGSGKSNILDAICFVLGITNMSTVRAQNLQDLIYKRGQAGITKASVTIVFDNSDKSKAPPGFEGFSQISVTRQIVLGGTSKYLINGSRAQQGVVQNLFHSVGLNINNPNFLIMQGRITKVLNMKATEFLSLIEEAAGTRMFEDRRDKALRTMAKKDKKVEEINDLLREEIEPKLDKLRSEKRAFLDFQQTQSDLERLTKLIVAHDYTKNKERMQSSAADLEEKKKRVKFLDENTVRLEKEIENLAEDTKRVKAQRDKELRKGGKFSALEEEVKGMSHEIIRLNTILDLKSTGISEEKEKRKEIQKSVKEHEKAVQEKTKAYERLKESYDTAKAEHDSLSKEAERQEELLQTLLTGVASKEGQESGYQSQLQEAKNRASTAATEQEQAKLKIAHLQKRIQEDEPRAKKAREQNATLLKDLEAHRLAAKKLEADIARLGYEEGKEEEIRREEADLEARIRDLTRQANDLRRSVRDLDFSYSNPSPDFDRSKVKGKVLQLFTLDEGKEFAGTALELAAGGKLYNIVVDTATTAAGLLKNGRLASKVTFIPLDQIQGNRASAEKVSVAKNIAPGKVELALSLIGYDQGNTKAMEFVFGGSLICADEKTAREITYDPRVALTSVTHDGTVVRVGGTLTGGSAPASAGILLKMRKIHALEQQIAEATEKLNSIREMLQREKKTLDMARNIKKQLDLKNHEISLTEEQISTNSSTKIIHDVEEMKEQIPQTEKEIVEAKRRQEEAQKEVKRIEKDMSEFKNNKGGKLAELKKTLETLKKNVAKQSQAMKSEREEFQAAQVELEQSNSDLSTAQESLAEVDAAVEALEAEIAELRKEHTEVTDAHDIANARLEDERTRLSSFDNELAELDEASRQKQARIAEEKLEKQKLGHEIEKFHQREQAAAKAVSQFESEYEFIHEEQDQFGRPGTPYDFHSVNISESRSTLKSLLQSFDGMKKKINPKVMNMIDNVEKKEIALKHMLRTVIKDKRKIEETIVELDRYKKEALEKTHSKVSADFGNIFAELLPGSFAKLVPPEGKQVTDGLEVKVQLGKVWKQSLTELSGGQRSLIALSLIMALLQFKPAPMYILDEVDAALDLSHTQNIGRLIKTRFKGSQFIVVSLKDGMFQNANRIFKTRFTNNTSTVQIM
ncbi:chromosomes protein 2 structural maintenance [Sphaerosporella brunnea]|uniref:Structural maintenance of chromosomes protein n=1 Tax=Sphaerosporella brunnea TaxID=1250544 RepID=A0A5J5ERN1_9PEZI|nr:chromosomes protein 2 structural maintenance [Sphaerosporella brunnea]